MINIRERALELQSTMLADLAVKNVMALPRITQVSLNVGLGQNRLNKDMVSYIEKSLGQIAGQKAVLTKAKKAIAGFKIRAGDIVGVRVTLRGARMSDFLNRFINVTVPRIRDFKGFSQTSFDKSGNLTIGFRDQSIMAELGHDVLDKPFGLSITITIAQSTAAKSAIYLKSLGFPIKDR